MIIPILRYACHESHDLTNEEGALNKTTSPIREVIVGGVDLGYALRENENKTEAERGPESEEEDDGFGAEQIGGPDDGVSEED